MYGGPGSALRVDDIEMIGSGDDLDRDLVAQAASFLCPAFGEIGWDLIVVGSLDEELRDVQREEVAGVGGEVALGLVGGGATHQVVDLEPVVGEGEVAGEVDGELEVDGSGEGDDGGERHAGMGVLRVSDGASGDYVMASGEPEGEVSAGGVAGCDDATEVERVGLGEVGEEVKSGGDVFEGVGPAATGLADAAVLDRPDGYTGVADGGAEVAAIAEVVLGLPPAAVEEDEDGRLAPAGRQPEVAELILAGAVVDAMVGGGVGAAEQVHRRVDACGIGGPGGTGELRYPPHRGHFG